MVGPAVAPDGLAARRTRTLLSPRSRLGALVVLLAGAATAVAVWQPHEWLAHGWLPRVSLAVAVVLFALAYGLCTAALVPRPLLNLASGTLFGAQAGLAGSVAGTVLGAAVAFGLVRVLGQDALRPLLRTRWLTAADRQLSRHGFRSVLFLRLFPGVPFNAANYCAAVSHTGWLPFLLATGLGCVPNTTAYVIAGSQASDPLSPAFLAAFGFIVASALGGIVVALRRRRRAQAQTQAQAQAQTRAQTQTQARAQTRGTVPVAQNAPTTDPDDVPVTAGP